MTWSIFPSNGESYELSLDCLEQYSDVISSVEGPFHRQEAVKVSGWRTMVKQRGGKNESENCFEAFSRSHCLHGASNNVGGKRPGSRQINLYHAGLFCQCIRQSHQASLSMSDKPVEWSA